MHNIALTIIIEYLIEKWWSLNQLILKIHQNVDNVFSYVRTFKEKIKKTNSSIRYNWCDTTDIPDIANMI